MNQEEQAIFNQQGHRFNDFQDQILCSLVSQSEKYGKRNFKNISALYNQEVKKQNMSFKHRKPIDLKRRYNELKIVNRQNKSPWTKDIEKFMLKLVSQGYSWSEIARKQQFQKEGFTNNFIKNQFYTCQRMKVRTLMSYYGITNNIPFSDVTFQLIIKPSELNRLQENQVITQKENQLMKSLSSQSFFLSSRMDSENKTLKLRKRQVKEKLFKKYGLEQGKMIAQVIVKINESTKKAKRFIEENQQLKSEISSDLRDYYEQNLIAEGKPEERNFMFSSMSYVRETFEDSIDLKVL